MRLNLRNLPGDLISYPILSVLNLKELYLVQGYKELNSPYDACVVASADLTLLECLEVTSSSSTSLKHLNHRSLSEIVFIK